MLTALSHLRGELRSELALRLDAASLSEQAGNQLCSVMFGLLWQKRRNQVPDVMSDILQHAIACKQFAPLTDPRRMSGTRTLAVSRLSAP